ncbi:MAG TPA: hypothetical protein VKE98_04580, partial [Gemmataceae bacterium]|nr:hypothetical protein [Gemmataceae bacterium]
LPLVITVDRLPQKPLAATVDQLPVALHGVVSGSGTVETKFQGKAKQKVMIEVEAQRLGSKLRPVVHLFGPSKLQIAWSWSTPTLFGDTRLEAVLPEAGTYTVSLHDSEYAAQAPNFFRMRIGEWSFVDQIFPPVVARGKGQALELLGMPAALQVNLPAANNLDALPLSWPKDGLWSGPRPFVTVSPHAEFVKQSPAGKMQDLPEGPVAVSGRLVTPYDEDRYRIAVTPGTKLRLEVFAERYGSPLDAALVVRNDKGDQLARAEDSPGTLDPVLEYTVPPKVNSIIVGVIDSQGGGGPRGIYRLVVSPAGPSAKESFKLFTSAQRVSMPIAGRWVLPVMIERKGYQGKIDLSAAVLPAGVKLDGTLIPEGADGALLTLQRGEANFDGVISTLRGRGAGGEDRPVLLKGHPLERLQPWLATEIALAPTLAKAADLQIDWRDLPADAGLVPGNKMVLPIKVVRTGDKTTVKLTLMTSQKPPLVNNQPDINKTLRQEKPVELPVKIDKGELPIIIPADLSGPVYDVTIQAELLAPDKKVQAVAFAPVRRMALRLPLAVALGGPNRIDVPLDPKKGATVLIKGKVERKEGLKGDVQVTLTGLPPGARADAVTVKAAAADFSFNVILPPNFAAGEIKGLKLSASAAPDAKQPNVRVRSKEVEVTLVVKTVGK